MRGANNAGTGHWSDVVSGTTQLVLGPPDAPTELSATAVDASRIDLAWTAPSGDVTSYDVEWSADGETGWTAVDPAHSGTDATYRHTGLTANTTYHYRVGASNDAGYGAWSDLASATTQSAAARGTQPPDAPTNISATASGESRIDVS